MRALPLLTAIDRANQVVVTATTITTAPVVATFLAFTIGRQIATNAVRTDLSYTAFQPILQLYPGQIILAWIAHLARITQLLGTRGCAGSVHRAESAGYDGMTKTLHADIGSALNPVVARIATATTTTVVAAFQTLACSEEARPRFAFFAAAAIAAASATAIVAANLAPTLNVAAHPAMAD